MRDLCSLIYCVVCYAEMNNIDSSNIEACNPSLLRFHNRTVVYASFDEFKHDLSLLLREGHMLSDLVALTKLLGVLDPITFEHSEPDYIQIKGDNLRETLRVNGLISRNRAVLHLLRDVYGSLEGVKRLRIYMPEYYTGFAVWMSHYVGNENLVFSEYLAKANLEPRSTSALMKDEDLCDLSFDSDSFDLVICNELFEHVRSLRQSFSEILRVLRPGGSLVATFPMAFGQYEHIQKSLYDPDTHKVVYLDEPEFHGDPVRPSEGSLVFEIPGWKILDDLCEVGYITPVIRHTVSWQFGIYGSDLPGILILHARKPPVGTLNNR